MVVTVNTGCVADDKFGLPCAAGLAGAVYQFVAGHAEAVGQ